MTPAQEYAWGILLDVSADFPTGWCLIGGQMVWLFAHEHGVEPIRATEDVDVAVDIRADQGAIKRLCTWLESRGFQLGGVSRDGIGHRYVSSTYKGPGAVVFDILAPDNLGARVDLGTTPPARTVEAPGARSALDSAQPIQVLLGERNGEILRPSLLAAILVKAAATTIPARENPDRDWLDAAFLLCLVPDPVAAAAELRKAQIRRLRVISALLDENHWAWRRLGGRARLGHATLQFLISD
jgi:hypothetical protein